MSDAKVGSLKIPGPFLSAWEKCLLKRSPKCRTFSEALWYNKQPLQVVWETYTQKRKSLGRLPFTDVKLVAPYLLGFHMGNWARMAGLISRSLSRGLQLPDGEGPIRILDLGCGTGAGSLAALYHLQKMAPGAQLQFELVDRSRHLLEAAEEMLKSLEKTAQVRTLNKSLDDQQTQVIFSKWLQKPARLNIVLLGYVWNEFSNLPRMRQLLKQNLQKWSQSSTPTWLFITDPAAEASAKEGQNLRADLIDLGWNSCYPCLNSNACPMIAEGRDWCYSEFEYEKPYQQIEIEKKLKISRLTLGSAAYGFINKASRATTPLENKDRIVVVGRPTQDRHQLGLLMCNGSEIIKTGSKNPHLRGLLLSPQEAAVTLPNMAPQKKINPKKKPDFIKKTGYKRGPTGRSS